LGQDRGRCSFWSDFFRSSDLAARRATLCQNGSQLFSKMRNRSPRLGCQAFVRAMSRMRTPTEGPSLLVCHGCQGCLPSSQVGEGGGVIADCRLRNFRIFRVFRGFTPRLHPCEVNGDDKIGAIATKDRKERKRGMFLRVPCVPCGQSFSRLPFGPAFDIRCSWLAAGAGVSHESPALPFGFWISDFFRAF
jgi:hypothetical protein